MTAVSEEFSIDMDDAEDSNQPLPLRRQHMNLKFPSVGNKKRLSIGAIPAVGGERVLPNFNRKRLSLQGSTLSSNNSIADQFRLNESDVILQDLVQLSMGLQTHHRYLFLLKNVLLLTKQKSSTNFHVKEEVEVSEIWLAECIKDVSEVAQNSDRSFVIGWPTINFVVTFVNVKTKDIWLGKLQELIAYEKSQQEPQSIVVKIVNSSQAFSVTKSLLVGNYDDARSVLARYIQDMHIPPSSAKDFQFIVQSDRENHPYALIGHEHPYAIQMNYVREKYGTVADATNVGFNDQLRFQIVEKKKELRFSRKFSIDETRSLGKASKSVEEIRSPSKSSKAGKLFRKSSKSVKGGKIFGRGLGDLFEHGTLCAPVMNLLSHLFIHGTNTAGIFRKSATMLKCQETKIRIDRGDEFDFTDVHAFVTASLLKELMRCLPDSLLLCELYSKWIKISTTIELSHNLANCRIKSLFQILPNSHQAFLRYLMCILYHISKHSSINGMTAHSLSICISPSLLWPSSLNSGARSQLNDMKRLNLVVERMIDGTAEIFGSDCIHLFDHLIPERNESTGSFTTHIKITVNADEESEANGRDLSFNSRFSRSAPQLPQSPDLSPKTESIDSGVIANKSVSFEDFDSTTSFVDHRMTVTPESDLDMKPSFVTSSSVSSTEFDTDVRKEETKPKLTHLKDWFGISFEEDAVCQTNLNGSCNGAKGIFTDISELAEFSSSSSSNSPNMNSLADSDYPLKFVAFDDDTISSVSSTKSDFLYGTDYSDISHCSLFLEKSGNNCEEEKRAQEESKTEDWTSSSKLDIDIGSSDSTVSASGTDKKLLLSVISPEDQTAGSVNSVHKCGTMVFVTVPPTVQSVSHLHQLNEMHSVKFRDLLNSSESDESEQSLVEKEQKISDVLPTSLSLNEEERQEETSLRTNFSSGCPKVRLLRLKRGMTHCGADIFPTQFIERLRRNPIGNVEVSGVSKTGTHSISAEKVINEQKQMKTSVNSSHLNIPSSGRGSALQRNHSNIRQLQARLLATSESLNNDQRVRPTKLPSYSEAVAEKALMKETFPPSSALKKTIHLLKPHSLVSPSQDSELSLNISSRIGMDWNVPDLKLNVGSLPDSVSMQKDKPVETQVNVGHEKHLPSDQSKSPPSTVTDVSHVSFLSNKNILFEPQKDTTSISSDSSITLTHPGNDVKTEARNQPKTGHRTRTRILRQHSSDPKLIPRHRVISAVGRSKSDSSDILKEKHQNWLNNDDKENISVSNNSVLKRKLTVTIKMPKLEEVQNKVIFHCGSSAIFQSATEDDGQNSGNLNTELSNSLSPENFKRKKSMPFRYSNKQFDVIETSCTAPDFSRVNASQRRLSYSTDSHEIISDNTSRSGRTPLIRKSESLCETHSSSSVDDGNDIETALIGSRRDFSDTTKGEPDQVSSMYGASTESLRSSGNVSELKQKNSELGVSDVNLPASSSRLTALHKKPYFV